MLISFLSPGSCNFPFPWLWLIAYAPFLPKKHLEEATARPAPWHLLIFIHLLYLQVILGAPWDWRPFRQGWWLVAFSVVKKVRLLQVTFFCWGSCRSARCLCAVPRAGIAPQVKHEQLLCFPCCLHFQLYLGRALEGLKGLVGSGDVSLFSFVAGTVAAEITRQDCGEF